MSIPRRVLARLRREGPRAAIAGLAEDAARRVVDLDRTVILMRVDLTDSKHHRRPRDTPIELLPLDRRTLPRVTEMLRAAEPARIRSVLTRLGQGMSGWVARSRGEIAGYVFWVEHDPNRLTHSDLAWLPISPGPNEIYTFDYFVPEHARGIGAPFVRAVQQAHFQTGYTAAHGYVYAHNTAALWLYRTSGWKEVGRVTEHRILSRFAMVGGTLYRMDAFSRTPLLGRNGRPPR